MDVTVVVVCACMHMHVCPPLANEMVCSLTSEAVTFARTTHSELQLLVHSEETTALFAEVSGSLRSCTWLNLEPLLHHVCHLCSFWMIEVIVYGQNMETNHCL